MTPELQTYASQETAYQKFCKQYNLVESDPASRKEYQQWILLEMKIEGERRAHWEYMVSIVNDPEAMRRHTEKRDREYEAMERQLDNMAKEDKETEEMVNQFRAERREENRPERRAEKRKELVLYLKSREIGSIDDIAKLTGLTIAEVEELTGERAKWRVEIAQNIKNQKTMSDEEIAKLTGLTIAEVEAL